MDLDDIVLDDYDFNIELPSEGAPSNVPSTSLETMPIETTESATQKEKLKKKKFDENLLLSSKGIPRLKNEAPFLRFEGKGYEEHDLKKLMRYYQLWANNLYPKFRFTDFAKKVTKPASTKAVKEMIAVWQEEFRQRKRVRDEIEASHSGEEEEKEEEEEEEEEEAYQKRIRDSIFPDRDSTEKQEENRPRPNTDKNEQEEIIQDAAAHHEPDHEPETTAPVANRADALSILAERRRKRVLPTNEDTTKASETKEKEDSKQFIELSDSEDEQPLFANKRRMIRHNIEDDEEEEDEEDTLSKAKQKYREVSEADIDLASIPMIEDIQLEDLNDIQLEPMNDD
ncbi:hypothetical protein G6F16_010933 [Rhizopus arrhizus]|uniref:Chromosome segregation in meiosis protein n=1 Tax=Rhizopus oryzae TaxID=64495 RepID=A0A9P7BMQ5_RHIOR|nr:hypothetical protein G6F23_002919 [Rhizopus arrhizus]KAG0757348.1 hypothetical protein G6F24_010539 [Rhizopus arrhizus]KAG0783430.1 hypothetical protein G6F21_010537 [Rhizopus arrhizus]KAG0800133.1 hypothetical protein G6F22_002537 [Rhizopus arrhizus]KAG0806807.1 hypothetical protein G6F20_010841 [Rhizopus arrhizus]